MQKLGKPLTVWCSSVFETEGVYSIVPVQLVKHRTVSVVTEIENEPVLVMCPCVNF